MRIVIGIDDTDNVESRGTGFRARQLGELLVREGGCELLGITRHQLLVAPEIPYTSHNSSACLVIDGEKPLGSVAEHCREFLIQASAPGSDAGLCIAPWDDISGRIQAFGRRAKQQVLRRSDAVDLAAGEGLLLEGLTGTRDGMIGALAAVGLRRGGSDGRFIWLRGIRELSGTHQLSELLARSGIDVVQALDGEAVAAGDRIDLGDWFRPILRDHRAVLLVTRPVAGADGAEWCVAPKERIKAESD